MIDDMLARCADGEQRPSAPDLGELAKGDRLLLTRAITAIENAGYSRSELEKLVKLAEKTRNTPTLGVTGTGGSGKSSTTDELIRRFRQDSNDSLKIAVLAIDPTRKKTGGALLGDRIRMNAISHPNIFMRSIATRSATIEIPEKLGEILCALKVSQFDLIIIETPGRNRSLRRHLAVCDDAGVRRRQST